MLFVKRIRLLNWPRLAEFGMFICTHPFPSFDRSQDLTNLFEVVMPPLATAATSSNMDLRYGAYISAELVQFELQDDFRFQN